MTFPNAFRDMTKKRPLLLILLTLLVCSCGEYAKVQESTDVMEKYRYAKKYYDEGDYTKSTELLEVIVPYLTGSTYGEEAMYLLAQSYYHRKTYDSAYDTFKKYYNRYPNGQYDELARFYAGYGLALDVRDARLDQEQTYMAMKELQSFLEHYPQSEKAEEAKQTLFDLQDHLALKELLNVELYYNLGNYIFNNYESAIITARAALKDYPYSKYTEDIHYYIVASMYEVAKNSVISKQQSRLRELRDEYYNYINEFPEGKHRPQVETYFQYAEKNIKEDL